MKLLYRPLVAQVIAVITVVYLAGYLWWRVSASLNPAALAFSLVFLAAEAYGVLSFVLFALMTWDVDQTAPFVLDPGLRVDVFVPTYDEDLEILEATLIGCGAMRYPHTTYVLDDGRRPTVAMLAARLGCRYLTRADNLHAKAGNLNAALPRTEGDFIVVLDADVVPQPDFLDRTLGYFVDERVALVQLPQEFYNLDSVQHESTDDGMKPWHDQALFYRVIQPGKNRWNAAFWCGSPSVVRRTALESIGGVATDTVTEDIHTSVRLHARGWKTVYHNEALAYGIAPQTLQAFSIQRMRWAQGAMQLLRGRDNPLITPGLSVAQRLNYVASILTYFDPYQKVIFLVTPALILLTGLFPLRVSAVDYIAHWIPYFGLTILANVALGRGSFSYLQVEKYNHLKMFTFLRATAGLVGVGRPRFRVTPKNEVGQIDSAERRLVVPHLIFVGLEVGACVVGVLNLLWGVTTVYADRSDSLMALGWAIVNAGILGVGIAVVLHRFYRRQSYRFPIDLTATVTASDQHPISATVRDLSLYGVGLTTSEPIEAKRLCTIVLDLPGGSLTIRGDVANCRALADGRWRLGVQFILFSPEDRTRLIAFLFIIAPRTQRGRAGLPYGTLVRVAHAAPPVEAAPTAAREA